ncbi:MAG: CRISPR-associated helicase Cas3' [Chromatiales bacterium]|nr:CRISPR-associated helicase Cas3' [Chromatiales bacterium]
MDGHALLEAEVTGRNWEPLRAHLNDEPWGKRRSTDGNIETARLGLAEHSMDVAAVFDALAALPSIRDRLARLAGGELTETVIARLAVLAFLHDIGKASVGFQSKSLPTELRGRWLADARIEWNQCGHTRVVAGLLFNAEMKRKMVHTGFPLADMDRWGSPVLDLWLAAISHHGEPIIAEDLCTAKERWWTHLWASPDGYDPMAAVAALGRRARRWFPAAWNNHAGDLELPDAPAFVHYFAGLVSLADWIASNDATGFFPYDGHGDGDRAGFSRKRAREVLRRMRVDVEDARADLGRRAPAFGDVFRAPHSGPLAATPLQRAMEDRTLGSVVIAESETGSGKTEAALWRFKTLFEAGEVDALAFLLPTRVAAVSLEGRVRRFFEQLFPDPELRPNVVLAVPGYIQSDGERGSRQADGAGLLSRFETLWPDTAAESAAHRRWAAEHPKRSLAAAAAVGTIDQALLSGLPVRHAHLRGAALLRALIVADEVHASDAYMTELLTGVLRRHVDAGGHALLLSATLGSGARDRLLIQPTRRLQPNQKRRPDGAGDPSQSPYPALSDAEHIRAVVGTSTEKRVRLSLDPAIDDEVQIAAKAADAATAGAKVLVIRNDVKGAVAVQRALEAELGDEHSALFRVGGVPAPHHGRFAAPDRRVLDEAIEGGFGKFADRSAGVVLAGTQTLEQSLDIDADFLITDLAPVDVLLQRFGRLHRHRRTDRAVRFTAPAAIVLIPVSRDLTVYLTRRRGLRRHGIGGVYENVLSIEATWRALEACSELTIPAENRALVEAATRFSELASLAQALGGQWEAHWREYVGVVASRRGAADTIRLDWSEPWDEQRWPAGPGERTRTRLGLDDRLVELSETWISPFGQVIERMKIPGWMVKSQEEHEENARITGRTSTELRFHWGGGNFVYNRHGLDFAEDAGGGPSSPVRKGGRRRE